MLLQTVDYTLVGSPPGTNFFTMSNSGQITISADLNTDLARLLSYRVSRDLLDFTVLQPLTAGYKSEP